MRKRNGKYYRKVKTCMGHVYWVEMPMEEVIAHDLELAGMILIPLLIEIIWAWAAGII